MEKLYVALADFILISHTLVVLFIVGGFIVIWAGYFRRWTFVRNFYFRAVHLGAMGYVAAQVICGADCPLTVWENQLRIKGGAAAYEEGFIAHWLRKFLFFEFPPEAFAIVYLTFFVLIVLSWFLVKPQRPRRKG